MVVKAEAGTTVKTERTIVKNEPPATPRHQAQREVVILHSSPIGPITIHLSPVRSHSPVILSSSPDSSFFFSSFSCLHEFSFAQLFLSPRVVVVSFCLSSNYVLNIDALSALAILYSLSTLNYEPMHVS